VDLRFVDRSRKRALLRTALLLSDATLFFAAAVLAAMVQFGVPAGHASIADFARNVTYIRLAALVTIVGLSCIWLEHLYDLDRIFWGSGEYTRVAKAVAVAVGGLVLLLFAFKLPEVSRGWLLLTLVFAFVLVGSGRAAIRWSMLRLRRQERFLSKTLVVGANAEAVRIITSFRKNPSSGLVPVACLAASAEERSRLDECEGVPCLGYAREIARVLDEGSFDTVLIVPSAFGHEALAGIINDLRGRKVDTQLSSGLFEVLTRRVLVRELSGVPVITIKVVSFALWQRALKRSLDLVVGAGVALVGMPLWLLIALAIRLDSKGPVLYTQARIGRDGRPFGMYKFRSMCDDAETRLADVIDRNEATGPLFKMRADPRVTRVGRYLRRYSLDEIPQLINVIRGEMSLVGPRPPLVSETARYTARDWRRMEVLPGMTGLWQVSGRSAVAFDEMIHLDLFYIENWSVGFDLSVMARTIHEVLWPQGAY
jgi:exopolysaccharide biosynthesis polyprenyl glycosylphosphotransferase